MNVDATMVFIISVLLISIVASDAWPYLGEKQERHSPLADVITSELINKLKDGRDEASGDAEPENKIIGGWSATSGMLPHQVFISIYGINGLTQSCGGSLISRRHVLTAAHCLYRMTGAIVALGTSDNRQFFGPGVTTLTVQGSYFIIHPDYEDGIWRNDIAILRLPRQVSLSFTIGTIALPSGEQTAKDYFAGKEGLISGFGKTSDEYYDFGSEKLQMAYANITTLEECQTFWRRRYRIQETQICTRFQGTGTCQGDSGGPLAVEISDKLVLVGLTSFGSTQCERAAHSVYTNVAAYLQWIQQVIKIK